MKVQGSDRTRTGERSALAGYRRRLAVTAAAATTAALAGGLAACSGSREHLKPPVSLARLSITPATGSSRADPSGGVTVSVSRGTIRDVTVTRGSQPVDGSFNAAHTSWHTTWPLLPSRSYTVTASAIDKHRRAVTQTSAFRTVRPRVALQTQIIEGSHQVYGVGMPVILTFSHPVAPQYRAAVERSIQLTTSKPVVGAWYWDKALVPAGTSLVFRTRAYWPQHTRVSIVAHLAGVKVARGVYGTSNLSQSWRIGKSLIAVVDTSGHYAHIYYGNKLFGVWPISTGSPGDDTANGTYLTIEKGNPVLMSGPGYHDFPVPYSVRFTWSGNYMHDAYWSVGEQGYSNVSHGCVNLSPENAATYYNLAVPGDPVTVIHSPSAGTWDDGWTQWFLSWKQLLKGSATHMAVEAGPTGSSFVSPGDVPSTTLRAPLRTSYPGNAGAS